MWMTPRVNADGEIVSKEVGEEERGTGGCVDRRGGDATAVTPSKVEGESLSPVTVPAASKRRRKRSYICIPMIL